MTDVLTKEEIDKLLAAINTGDTEPEDFRPVGERKIKVYDFKRPDRFSKDQIRVMSMIHEAFSRLAVIGLSAQLQSLVHVNVASVDQLTYEEFIRSVPTPTTLAVIDMEPLKGRAIIEIDPAIAFSMFDLLLGGMGDGTKSQHELTDIEQSVMEEVIIMLMGNMREAWREAIDLRPKLMQIETNPQFAHVAPPTEMVALITMEAKVGDIEGMINICYPYPVTQGVMDKITAAYGYGDKAVANKSYTLANREDIPVTMIAEVFRRDYPIKEVAEWQEGKILLPLRRFTPHTCYLRLGDRRVWQCEIMNDQKGFLKRIKIIGQAARPLETEGIMELSKVNPVVGDALSMAEVRVSAELGATVMLIKQVLEMGEGTVVELDKLAGEPLDVKANGVLIAKGEVVVIDENFGVRITEIVGSPNKPQE